jgi:hypothetical protein
MGVVKVVPSAWSLAAVITKPLTGAPPVLFAMSAQLVALAPFVIRATRLVSVEGRDWHEINAVTVAQSTKIWLFRSMFAISTLSLVFDASQSNFIPTPYLRRAPSQFFGVMLICKSF